MFNGGGGGNEKRRECRLLQMLSEDPDFCLSEEEIRRILDPVLYTGRCRTQVEVYLEKIRPLLPEYGDSGETIDL